MIMWMKLRNSLNTDHNYVVSLQNEPSNDELGAMIERITLHNEDNNVVSL